jgi:DMSO/TMAO reductase YedYZ molybdopterin-dependent catalytic subunit
MLDERQYLEERAEQRRFERALSRRPVVARPPAIVKPLPPEWFIRHGSNAEMRWESVRGQGYLTDTERFFVRNHTATPRIAASTWRLRVSGRGLRDERGVELDYHELTRLPSRELTAFIQCAGNGRRYYEAQQGTPAPGTQWGLGAIGVARWRGVPLAEVLERAGLRRDAVDVMPAGLDAPVVRDGVDYGHVRRPLPVAKALEDALLAYEMNGRELPPDHGFPVRLVVPGWIGVASVKWLGSLEVSDRPLTSPWNTRWYRMTGQGHPPDAPPLTTLPVTSAFELAWDAELPAGRRTILHGRSWSGHAPVRRVEVSTDGGARWRRVRLRHESRGRRNGWVRWELPFEPRSAGAHELRARATDASGLVQPGTVPFNDDGYQFWATIRHPVRVY